MRDLTVIYKENGELREIEANLEKAVDMVNGGMDIEKIIYEDGSDNTKEIMKIAAIHKNWWHLDIINAYIECFGIDRLTEEDLKERYYGCSINYENYGYEQAKLYMDIPDWAESWFDYEAFGEAMAEEDFIEHDGCYFRNY